RRHFSRCLAVLSFPRLAALFFFTDPPTTAIYTLSLHDALPISLDRMTARDDLHASIDRNRRRVWALCYRMTGNRADADDLAQERSEEHTSELQSLRHLVCRLLLEKKKKKKTKNTKEHKNTQSRT